MSLEVAICTPTRFGITNLHWSHQMQSLLWDPNTHVILLAESRGTAAQAREHLVEAALKAGVRYIWFVDDDTVPPRDAGLKLLQLLRFERIRNTKVRAATGIYFAKQAPTQPLIFRGAGEGAFWDWKVGDIFPIDSCGAGCLMIRADVFKELPRPWFHEVQELTDEGVHNQVGEDIFFCDRLRAAGFGLLAHGGVLCEHMMMPRLHPDDEANPDRWLIKYALPKGSPPAEPRPDGALMQADGRLVKP